MMANRGPAADNAMNSPTWQAGEGTRPGYSTGANAPTPTWRRPVKPPDPRLVGPWDQPGLGEQWWSENQNRFQQPLSVNDYWHGIQGDVLGMNYNPAYSPSAYGRMEGAFSGPSWGQNVARDVSDSMAGPTWGENQLHQAGDYFKQPNLTYGYAGSAVPQFQTPGQIEGYYDQNAGYFRGPGQGENTAYDVSGQLNRGPGVAENNYQDASNTLAGINYGDDSLRYTRGALSGANQTEQFNQNLQPWLGGNTVGSEYGYFAPGLRNKSYSEQLYDSGNQGLNTYYQREEDKRTKALENKMAASGVFGSGATAKALYELHGELGANQARDMADLARQADEARLGRGGQALAFAGEAGKEGIARRGLGLSAATAADQSINARVQRMLDAYGLASGEALQKVGLKTSAANVAEQNMIDRLFKSGELGLKGQEAGLNRVRTGADIARSADDERIARLLGGSTVARAGDQSLYEQGRGLLDVGRTSSEQERERQRLRADVAHTADEEERQRLNDLFNSGLSLDKEQLAGLNFGLDKYKLGFDINKQIDQDTWKRLMDQFGMSKDVQNLGENRTKEKFDEAMRIAENQSRLTSGATGAANDEQTRLAIESIEAQLRAAGMSQEEINKEIDSIFGAGAALAHSRGK